MIAPLSLSLEDVGKITEDPGAVYYKRGAIFLTTKKQLLQCDLDENQKATVMNFPDYVKLRTVEMGTFTLDL